MGMGDSRMKRYTIGLITGILLTASALPLIAQEDASGLTLEKCCWVNWWRYPVPMTPVIRFVVYIWA